MKISVITINYNNKVGLESTLLSVRSQTTTKFEYIIVDGGSIDGSLDVIKMNHNYITKWISEKDNGIYEAMNKAVRMATGEYCLFLNSGDILYSKTTIEEISTLGYNDDFILGSVISKQGRLIKAPQNITMANFVLGSIAHQASLIKKSLLISFPYDEKLRIVSDWKFGIQTLILNNCTYKAIKTVIAIEEPNGISHGLSDNHKKERDLILNEYLPKRILNDYKLIQLINKKPLKWIFKYIIKSGNH